VVPIAYQLYQPSGYYPNTLRGALVLFVCLAASCSFDDDLSGTRFMCADTAPRCPDGFTCMGQFCEEDGTAADAQVGGADAMDALVVDGAPPDADMCPSDPTNGACGNATPVMSGVRVYGDNTAAHGDSINIGIACYGNPGIGWDEWFSITTTAANQEVTATLTSTDANLALLAVDSCAAMSCLAGDDTVNPTEQITFTAPTAGTYYIVVDGAVQSDANSGCFSLDVEVN
jgi:hypothetical protein